ncbi:MAG TPA: YbhB/YbcL family Raf kinase inhibitor-like protein [Chromatiales bacterium]|nr:YbhB/YbcL family Raf kinase inhibitor-like protein [Chromatiales bacterium]
MLAPAVIPAMADKGGMVLKSETIMAGQMLGTEQVFKGFGCDGENRSPALSWTPGPESTRSYALTVYDPDAPTGSGWWHWVVYNIPADVTSLAVGAGDASGDKLPAGARQGRTDFGSHAYGGACPPEGDKPHRYIFTVYALKTDTIDVQADASAAMIGFMINANMLGKATLTAKYAR